MERYHVFSYGSNSVAQLRGRVRNATLTASPAIARDYDRIFCMSSSRWGGTGAASLAPAPGKSTWGAVAALTAEELELLDSFEFPAYERVKITVTVTSQESRVDAEITAFAYLAKDCMWKVPPSEQYLTAIHVMLREQWPEQEIVIAVKGVFDVGGISRIIHVSDWRHPGATRLGLPALCVEVNSRLAAENSWVMPRTIVDIEEKLSCVGIASTPQLAVWLTCTDLMTALNEKLKSVDQRPFHLSTLQLFKEALELS
jgi:hypothetical protein